MPAKTSGPAYYLLLFTLMASGPELASSQTQILRFDSVAVDLGIPAAASAIFQDKTGFIWIGTYSGLYKYDGYRSTPYCHDPEDSTSLRDNRIVLLYEDKAGVLWAGTWAGLERFDRESGTFKHFTPNPRDTKSHEGNFVYSILEDRVGNLWVGTLHSLNRFDRATEVFSPVPHDADPGDDITHSAVLAIYEDKEGQVWFGTRAGLQKYDTASGKFKHCLAERDYEILSIVEDEEGTLWLAASVGLKAYNRKEGTCATYVPPPAERGGVQDPIFHVRRIWPDVIPGSLLLAVGEGFFAFQKRSKSFVNLKIPNTELYFERSGTVLFSTATGVKKYVVSKPPFKEYSVGGQAVIMEVPDERGILWTFGGSGWQKFDAKTGRFVSFSFGRDQLFGVHGRRQGRGKTFIAEDGSFCVRDSLGRRIFNLDNSWQKVYGSIISTCRTTKGYYAGCEHGEVYLLDSKTKSVSEVLNLQQLVSWIFEDRSGYLWVATIMGRLIRYDQGHGTFTEFVHDKDDPSSWCGNPVYWMYEDGKGRIWISTGYGLDQYDASTNSFSHITEKNGLVGNNVRGAAEDDHGYLWVSTTKGFSRFDPAKGIFKNYDASYGFKPPIDFYGGGIVRGDYGEMYAGGGGGLICFYPDSLHDNLFVPPIVITSLRVFDRPLPLSGSIQLTYDNNFLSFEFAALSYVSPERNQYAYKMEGVDRDWVDSGTRRYVNYANLAPGEYTFRVKGSNNEGVWNQTGTSIAIAITPPWWKTRWAYGFYVLAVLGALYTTWKLQLRRIRIRHAYEMTKFEAEKLHELDELKSRFFANISHEFRTPLTLILGPVKELADELEDKRAKSTLGVIHQNAGKLLNLVNELLDLSKLESGNMKLQTTEQNIVQFVKDITRSFCPYAERKRIDLSFQSEEEEILGYIDKDKIEKVLTNILSNAFKFTPEGGRIGVSIVKDAEYVRVEISDTGIGIPEEKIPLIFDRFYQVDGSRTREQEGTGIGLSLTKELVELHKGTIGVESEEGKGTTFNVRLPLGKTHLKPEEISAAEQIDEFSRQPEKTVGEEETAPTAAGESHIDTGSGEGKPLVLIVEDNADVRAYVRNNLTADWKVIDARDGEEGWDRAVEQLPELIVSDVMMPKMDGFQLCGKLKSDERTSHIPVILLTAKATSQDKIEGFETGADEYITKPFEPAELRARIRNLLEQRVRLHEHFRKHGLFQIQKEKITSVDQRFLEKLFAAVSQHISDVAFGVEPLAECMAVSRSLLLKKLDALTGESPVALIRRIRLEKAGRLIEGKFGNIAEIALEVGFNNPSYFSECFRKQFGVGPREYQHKRQAGVDDTPAV